MQTLPDLLAPGLRVVSVGLNPSLPSVAAGFYFANPRNRFWAALNASGLVDEELQPGLQAMRRLLDVHRIGFTDLVKRPTRGAGDLRAADYRAGATELEARLESVAAQLLWFHGRVAWGYFLRYARGARPSDDWGLQRERVAGAPVFVTPNPSPANAAFSLDDLTMHYRALARCLTGVEGGG
ncbi:MAG: mismatch-specific DNA-glycosylase [Acidihalobacter sp.]